MKAAEACFDSGSERDRKLAASGVSGFDLTLVARRNQIRARLVREP